MNGAPKDGDFVRYVEQTVRAPAAGAYSATDAARQTHTADDAAEDLVPLTGLDAWEQRWKPVFDFFIQSRLYLFGLLASVTITVAATVAFLVSAAIYSAHPAAGFLMHVFEDNPIARVVASEVRARYQTRVVEAAEEFQSTGKAPPGVAVTQNGSAVEVDGAAIRKQMPLAQIMVGAAVLAMLFGFVVRRIVQDLIARAPRSVGPRALWAAVAGLATLELLAYLAHGIPGLFILLLVLGGLPQALWKLIRFGRDFMGKPQQNEKTSES
jgi:hypothetical protein